MKAVHKVLWVLITVLIVLLGVLSFAGYWIGADVLSLLSKIPGVGHTLSAILYAITWPGGRILFPLLFLYAIVWNSAVAKKAPWARLVGIAINVFVLVFLVGIFFIALPLWSAVGIYHWLFLLGWLLAMASAVSEIWWLSKQETDAFFASRYLSYRPANVAGLPVGEVVPEGTESATRKNHSGQGKTATVPPNNKPRSERERKPSLARFYDETAKKQLLVFQPEVHIGRDAQNDMVIADSTVSGKHAVLTYRDGTFRLQDIGSSNGTFVNGKKITNTVLSNNDTVRFGRATYKFQLPRGKRQPVPLPSEPKNTVPGASRQAKHVAAAWLVRENGDSYPLKLGKNTIGRQDDNDVVLRDTTISRHHAVLYVERDAMTLQDLSSSNGTFVNDKRLGRERSRVEPGTGIRFGNQSFNLRREHSSEENEADQTLKDAPASSSIHVGKDSPEPQKQAFLVDSGGHRILVSKKETKIGRSPANDITVKDQAVSAFHAIISVKSAQFFLRDLDSTNGTIVNGSKIKEHTLQQDDIVQFGQSKFVFQIK